MILNKPMVSFVIPTYEDVSLLENCLRSLRSNALDGYKGNNEIIIVDDGSSPPTQEAVSRLGSSMGCKVILKTKNDYFTQAVNCGLEQAHGSFYVLVNNDIEFSQKGWLGKMLSLFDNDPKIAVAGCRLIYPNGLIQHGGLYFRIIGHHMFGHMHVGRPRYYLPAMTNQQVIGVTGALMMIRTAALRQIGYLDEKYPLTCSDTDLCLRAQTAGWKVFYCGQAEAIHHEGATRGRSQESKPLALAAIEAESDKALYERWHQRIPEMVKRINHKLK